MTTITVATPDKTDPKPAVKVAGEVIAFITDQYEQKLFWDNIVDESHSAKTLDSLKTALTVDRPDVELMLANKDKEKEKNSCDNELRHLLTKLKFVNQLYDGFIDKTKNQINAYTMKDFCKE